MRLLIASDGGHLLAGCGKPSSDAGFHFFFFFVATVRRFGCGGYTPVLRGVFLSAFSGTGAGRGEILSFSAETGAYLKGAS